MIKDQFRSKEHQLYFGVIFPRIYILTRHLMGPVCVRIVFSGTVEHESPMVGYFWMPKNAFLQ